MENNNRSHNSQLTITAREFLLPSWPKILLYLLVGSLLILLWNARQLWDQFNNNIEPGSSADVGHLISKHTTWVDTLAGGRVAQIIFWAFIGCCLYICVWFATSIITNIRNDVVADEYIHPTGYSRAGYWHSIVARKIFLGMVVAVLIGFTILGLRLISVLAKLFYSAVKVFSFPAGAAEVIGSILGASLLVYCFILLAHIAVNAWRTVYSDL